MAISSPFSMMFGNSPIKPMQEHMRVACETAAQLIPFFEASIANDWEAANDIQQKIAELENDADKLKIALRLQLPKSLFLPVPRSDLLQLLSMQDEIPNRAKDIAGIMLGRKMGIPKTLQKPMVVYLAAAVATSEQALKAINELDELLEAGFTGRELKIVEKLIKELNNLENKTDKQQIKIRAALFKLEAELPPVDVMFLYRIVEWVGDLADRSQAVGSRLQMLLAR